MPEPHAVPAPESDKKQGDKLDHAVDTALDGGTGDTHNSSGESAQPTPQDKPLK